MKLADTLDLGSSAARHGGSSPSTRTICQAPNPNLEIQNQANDPNGSFFWPKPQINFIGHYILGHIFYHQAL